MVKHSVNQPPDFLADVTGPPSDGLDSWMSESEVSELMEDVISSSPEYDPDELVYLRGDFEISFLDKGQQVEERQSSVSHATPYSKVVSSENFRKILANLIINSFNDNWKPKSPSKRVLQYAEIVPARSKKAPRPYSVEEVLPEEEEIYEEEDLGEITKYARRSRSIEIVGPYEDEDDELVIDAYSLSGRFIDTVSWYPGLDRELEGMFDRQIRNISVEQAEEDFEEYLEEEEFDPYEDFDYYAPSDEDKLELEDLLAFKRRYPTLRTVYVYPSDYYEDYVDVVAKSGTIISTIPYSSDLVEYLEGIVDNVVEMEG